MPKERLRELLNELHEELENTDSLDEESRAMLNVMRGDIVETLDADEPGDPSSVADQLRETVERYEKDHPELVVILNRVLEALGHIGI